MDVAQHILLDMSMVRALSSCAHRPVLEQSSSCSIKAEAKKLEQATKIQNGSKGIDVEEWSTPDPGRFTPWKRTGTHFMSLVQQ
jgi:hypothetical protein